MSDTGAPLRLRFDAQVELADEGRLLIGGTGGRVLRITDAAATLVRGWRDGAEVGPAPVERSLARRLIDSGFAHPVYASGPYGLSDLTVVIPVLDDADGVAAVVESLDTRLAVVVVDDGSADPSAVVRAAGRASVLRRDEPGGPAAARELGRTAVRTPLTAFVDADCVPATGWLDALLPHFADPAVAAVAPRVRSRPGASLLDRYEVVRSPLDLGGDPATVRPLTRVSYVPSACLVVRSDVPAFDTGLRYGEDVDLVWRVIAEGGAVRYEPAAEAWHRPRSSWRAWWRQRQSYGSSAAPLARRHPGSAVPAVLDRRTGVPWALVAIGRPAAGLAAAVVVADRLRRTLGRLGVDGTRAGRLVLRGQLVTGRWLATATTRSWWPLALTLAALHRRSRLPLAAAVLGPAVADWRRSRPDIDPVRYVALRLADDIAYGVGLWAGCRTEGSIRALVPGFTRRSSSMSPD
ncbi:MAG: mycofactocin biosynthesis glycosyltransferase MftF [Actinomycetota bacterium]